MLSTTRPSLAASLELPSDCKLEAGSTHTVARIPDAETMVLDDGREVRLAGILAPRSADIGALSWEFERRAIKALDELAAGQSVTLHLGGRRLDRYGRLLAQAVVIRANERIWIAGRMVELGMARAAPLQGTQTCLAALIRIEQAARSANLGLWQAPAYRIRDATRAVDLVPLGTTFQIIEGRVVSVGGSRGHVYLNFGSDRRRDFSASLLRKEAASLLPEAGRLRDLTGKLVRVRGWLGGIGSISIEATSSAQIEMIDALTISRPRRPWPRDATSR